VRINGRSGLKSADGKESNLEAPVFVLAQTAVLRGNPDGG